MDRALVAVLLILAVFLILTPAFIWINNRFNHDPEEIDDLSEEALMKLEVKKQLLHKLQQWINENHLTQAQIGEKLAVNQKTIAHILYQRVDQLSVDTLMSLLHRAGEKVILSINE